MFVRHWMLAYDWWSLRDTAREWYLNSIPQQCYRVTISTTFSRKKSSKYSAVLHIICRDHHSKALCRQRRLVELRGCSSLGEVDKGSQSLTFLYRWEYNVPEFLGRKRRFFWADSDDSRGYMYVQLVNNIRKEGYCMGRDYSSWAWKMFTVYGMYSVRVWFNVWYDIRHWISDILSCLLSSRIGHRKKKITEDPQKFTWRLSTCCPSLLPLSPPVLTMFIILRPPAQLGRQRHLT